MVVTWTSIERHMIVQRYCDHSIWTDIRRYTGVQTQYDFEFPIEEEHLYLRLQQNIANELLGSHSAHLHTN